MGWQSDPVVNSGGGWQADPIVQQSPIMQENKGLGQGVVQGLEDFPIGVGNAAASTAGSVFPSLDPGGTLGTPAPEKSGSPSYNTGRLIGQTMAAAPFAYGADWLAPEGFLGRLGAGTASGAVTGAAQPDGNTINNLVGGAMGGALGSAGAETLGQIIKPSISKAAEELNKIGVRTSVGQTLGGPWNDLEQKLTGIPGTGDMISNARRQAVTDLNLSQANAALAHVGESLDPQTVAGRGMVAEMDRKIGSHFDNVVQHLSWQPDAQTVPNLTNIIQQANLAPQQRRQVMNLIQSQFSKAGNNNVMSGELFKEIDSKLGNEAANYIGADDPDKSKYGAAIHAVQQEFRATLERVNAGSPYIDELKNANAAWADASRVRYAAGMTGAKEGVFGPGQFNNAVKHEALSNGQFARGEARMQNVSDAANTALGSTVPDSGTPARVIASLAAMGLPYSGMLSEGTAKVAAPALAANIAGMGLYSRPGQWLANRALTARPGVAAPIASVVRRLGPAAAVGLGGILAQQ